MWRLFVTDSDLLRGVIIEILVLKSIITGCMAHKVQQPKKNYRNPVKLAFVFKNGFENLHRTLHDLESPKFVFKNLYGRDKQ